MDEKVNKNKEFLYDYYNEVLSEDDARDFYQIQKELMDSYLASKDKMDTEEWLTIELKKHLPERKSEEIQEMSNEIITSLKKTEEMKASLQDSIARGQSKENWFASNIMKSISQMSTQESAEYLQMLDNAIKTANKAMYETIMTKNSNYSIVSKNINLDGFIVEQHHVNSYNMKSAALGGNLYAEVLKPGDGKTYKKNSVDIAIKDELGNIVQKYQSKYGATAEDTIRMIKEGNYNNQRLLVPENQVEAVKKAFPNKTVTSTIGEGDIKSTPLSKYQSKELQKKAQKGNFLDTDWNDYATKDIAIGISKQAGYSFLQGAVIGAGMDIATKLWNGEPIDKYEVAKHAIVSGTDFGLKATTAGALKLASEKEILKSIPKCTKGSTFANIAFISIENIKTFFKVATGEITANEGIDQMGQTSCSCLAGIAASTKGAEIGSVIGSIFGPLGITLGNSIGGIVGYMAGSNIGKTVVEGAKKVISTSMHFFKSTANVVLDGVKALGRGILNLFGF